MKLLWICPFRMYPVNSGGAHRAYNILRQLSRFHDVHAIIWQPTAELSQLEYPGTIHFYSPKDHPPPATLFDRLPKRFGPALQYRWLRRCHRGPADDSFLRCWHLIQQVLREQDIEMVLYEELGAMTAAPMINRLCPQAGQIVNLYNVNHKLQEQIRAEEAAAALEAESQLADYVDDFFACSEIDRTILSELSGLPGAVVPNGIDTEVFPLLPTRTGDGITRLLFCGNMAHPPNAEGIRWFLDDVWPRLTPMGSYQLTVVGRGLDAQAYPAAQADAHVDLAGEVEDVIPYYQACDLAIAPLRSGSGTRLKILEAMSLGRPMVSTPIGAEGLDAEHNQHLIIEKPEQFAEAINDLGDHPSKAAALRQAARDLVEAHYDWNTIGQHMQEAIRQNTPGRS